MASYDLQGAMNAGVPLNEIADFLASTKKYDADAARAAGIDDFDIIQELNKPEPGLIETFTGGVKRSIGELGVLAGDTLPALAASAVLPEEMAKPFVERQFKEAEESRAELERRYPSQYKSYKDVEDIRSGIGYVFERTGELVPDILPSLISGGIGYQVGKKAAQTAAEKAAVGVAERAGARAGEKITQEALEAGVTKDQITNIVDEVSQRAAADASKRFLEKSGKLIQEKGISGAKVGVYFGSYAQNSPEIFENIYQETGEIAPAGGLLFGGLSAYLDSFLPNQILGNLGNFGKAQLVSNMLKDSGANPAVWKSVLKEGSKAAVSEGLTESAQESISVAAEKFYGSNKEFFGPENIERYLESFFAGAAGGGVLGSVSGVARGLNEKAAAREAREEQPLLGVEEGLDPELATELEAARAATPEVEPSVVPPAAPVAAATAEAAPPGTPLLPGTTPEETAAAPAGTPLLPGPTPETTTETVVDTAVEPDAETDLAADKAAQIRSLREEFLKSDPEAIALAELDTQITGLRDELRAVREANSNLAGRSYTTPESVLEAIEKGELTLDPTTFQSEAELTQRVNALEDDFSKRQERLFSQPRVQKFFQLPQETDTTRPELTEEGDVAPTGPARRFVFKEDGTYGPQEAEVQGPQYSYAIDKDTKRMVFVDENGQPAKLSSKQQSEGLQAIDEIYKPLAAVANKGIGKKEKLPASFRSLPPDMRQAFLRALFVGFSPKTAFRQLIEYRQAFMDLQKGELESEKLFKDVKEEQKRKQKEFTEQYGDIYDLTYKAPPRKSDAERQTKERIKLAETEEKSRRRAVDKAAVERSIDQQPVGKGAKIEKNSEIMRLLKAGDISGALRALADSARDLRTMSGSATVVKNLATTLSKLNLRTKVVFGGSLAADRLAEYDPVTDTFTVRKGVALDEATMLHELVHAATVKVLNAYENFALTGDRGTLTDAQIEASEHLMVLMEQAKKRITSPQFEKAFENIYEFVAYAVTDSRFQAELGKHKARALAKYTEPGGEKTFWSAVSGAIMRLIDFIRRPLTREESRARQDATQEYLDENLESMVADKVNKKQIELDRALTEQEVEQIISQIIADVQIGINIDRGAFDPTGNFAIEVSQAFQEILEAPDRPIQMAPLPATATLGKKEETFDELQAKLAKKLEEGKPGIGEYKRSLDQVLSREGITNLVKKLQNERIWVKRFQDYLDDTGQLVSADPAKMNNIYTQLSLAAGQAKNVFQRLFYKDFSDANQTLADMSKLYKLPVEKMLARMHVYAIGLHGPERRRIKFLREVPLTSAVKDLRRQEIFDELAGTVKLSDVKIKDLRKELDDLVDQYVDTSKPSGDITNSKYNTLAHTAREEQLYRRQYDKDMQDPNKKALVDKYFNTLQKIQGSTVEANRRANYYTAPVDNFVNFYNFKNYFSFKGKPESEVSIGDLIVDPYKGPGGEFQDKAYSFEGRLSESDNPILNTLNEGARSALRFGRKDVTLTLKNLAELGKTNPDLKNIAEVLFNIPFKDRYQAGQKYLQELNIPTQNTVFHYNDDGSIDIIEIKDKEMREGVRRPLREDHPIIELANKTTSFFGQMHTRYNPAFAPFDFTRNLLTYAGIVAAEYGPTVGANIIGQMTAIIADGGMQKTAKFSLAFARGDTETMDKLAAQDPEFYGELARYFELGGRVSYIQSLSYRDNLLDAVEGAGPNPILRSKEKIDKFFDAWLDMFEMTSRMAAFRTMKKEFIAQGKSVEDAEVEAAAFAKNLANFEQVGEWGKTMGAFYMFFRPAATGAVRAIQSLAPAFDVRTDEQILTSIKQQKKFGGATDEQAQRALAAYNKQRKNARVSAVVIMGMGVLVFTMAYMMAGEDEEERNKVLTDDPARWVRNARFNTGIEVAGRDLVIQQAWGFGNGALASAGAQIAFAAYGGQGFLSMANNIMDATFESFLPLPVSKINKFEHPTAWAIDSITPSALRPLYEFTMNMDGLGREIYNNRQSRYADAYTGGDNIPQMFKDAAAYLYETTGVDVSPNSMYFFANNYLDGASRVAATTWGLGNVMIGRKDFDPRTDTFLLDMYLKAPSNYDSRMFSEAEKRIRQMEKDYKAVEGTANMADYMRENPMDKTVVNFYNSYVNGSLRDLRAEANRVRKDKTMSPAEKTQQLRVLTKQQNQIKSAFTTAIAGYDEDFGDLIYD
jgi:hypothetical protein